MMPLSTPRIISPATANDPYWSSVILLIRDNVDISNYSRNITAHGAAGLAPIYKWPPYAIDPAMGYFTADGATSLELTTGDFTIEAWVYLTAYTGSYMILLSKDGYGGFSIASYSFGIDPSGAAFMLLGEALGAGGGNYAIYNSGGLTVPLETWTHIAASVVSDDVRIFVNGEQGGVTAGKLTPVPSDRDLFIGWEQNQPSYTLFRGYIDDLRITKAGRYAEDFPTPTEQFPDH